MVIPWSRCPPTSVSPARTLPVPVVVVPVIPNLSSHAVVLYRRKHRCHSTRPTLNNTSPLPHLQLFTSCLKWVFTRSVCSCSSVHMRRLVVAGWVRFLAQKVAEGRLLRCIHIVAVCRGSRWSGRWIPSIDTCCRSWCTSWVLPKAVVSTDLLTDVISMTELVCHGAIHRKGRCCCWLHIHLHDSPRERCYQSLAKPTTVCRYRKSVVPFRQTALDIAAVPWPTTRMSHSRRSAIVCGTPLAIDLFARRRALPVHASLENEGALPIHTTHTHAHRRLSSPFKHTNASSSMFLERCTVVRGVTRAHSWVSQTYKTVQSAIA